VYRPLIQDAKRRKPIYWEDAVALLHVAYAWMPTMLRTEIMGEFDKQGKACIANILNKARAGHLLAMEEIESLKMFSNRSVVGASKMLHLINPAHYPIWDSRVAKCFLWPKVSRATFDRGDRYCQYQAQVLEWSEDRDVIRACNELRSLDQRLKHVSHIRLIEIVMFRSKK
jgi:hypothetical protein